jgi:hypothetical protein
MLSRKSIHVSIKNILNFCIKCEAWVEVRNMAYNKLGACAYHECLQCKKVRLGFLNVCSVVTCL